MLKPSDPAQFDESTIVELNSQYLKVNYVNKGGSIFESSSNTNNLKSKISSIDFLGG